MLLAAKVLVISRLLYNKISENPKTSTYIEGLRSRLDKLRQKLLAMIDRRLKAVSIESSNLTDVLCAISLARKSSTAEILRYFHRIRSDAIIALMQDQDETGDSALLALQLWICSLHDTMDIFPQRLSQALLKLKTAPLFNNPDLRSLIEIDHDIHSEWISDDIKNFTPYIRHDDLHSTTVTKQTATWAFTTLVHYRDGVSSMLGSIFDPSLIVELRKRTLELWFSNQSQISGIDRSQVFDSLRGVFITRLLDLIRLGCGNLSKVAFSVHDILGDWQEDSFVVFPSLWDKRMTMMDTSNGARPFIEALQSRAYGRNDLIKKTLQVHLAWLKSVAGFETTIKDMKAIKWEEEVDDIYESDEFADERQHLLAEVEPQELQVGLTNALNEAFLNMQDTMEQFVTSLTTDNNRASKAIFLLRLLRELKQQRPPFMRETYSHERSVQTLHRIVADSVTKTSLAKCRNRITKVRTQDRLPQRALWEGTPELPILPSPWVFKLLQILVADMAGKGPDLWSLQATRQLKILFRTSLAQELSTIFDSTDPISANDKSNTNEEQPIPADNPPPNSDTHPPNGALKHQSETPSSPKYTDRHTQHLFDLDYLHHATLFSSTSPTSEDELDRLKQKCKDTSHLPQTSYDRIEKAAREYWLKTGLLFALLG